MFYTIYKITNILNGKYYIGKHQTENLDDGYMGSGKLICRSVKKHGKENFKKEILFIFDNEEEMNVKEAEIVVVSEETYNLCEGGKGGFGYLNSNKLNLYGKNGNAGYGKENLIHYGIFWENANEEEKKIRKKKISESLKQAYKNGLIPPFSNKKHTKTTKQLMSQKAKMRTGSKNSQYGTFWITNGILNKKSKVNISIPAGWYKGRSAEVAQR